MIPLYYTFALIIECFYDLQDDLMRSICGWKRAFSTFRKQIFLPFKKNPPGGLKFTWESCLCTNEFIRLSISSLFLSTHSNEVQSNWSHVSIEENIPSAGCLQIYHFTIHQGTHLLLSIFQTVSKTCPVSIIQHPIGKLCTSNVLINFAINVSPSSE